MGTELVARLGHPDHSCPREQSHTDSVKYVIIGHCGGSPLLSMRTKWSLPPPPTPPSVAHRESLYYFETVAPGAGC